MSAYGGYAGKILKIDLCSRTSTEYPWAASEQAQYLGGKALAARILSSHLTGRERAFSEENWVVIATGPLTGTGAPGSVRFDIAALSPKDELPAFSNCGGNFGVWLKKAGYDALILAGRCKDSCWLEIHEDRLTFHDARELWGTGTGECQKRLSEYFGTDGFGRLCIGPAGEKLVKFAAVLGDGHAAGRAGIGAVLGWKNLKAVTVSGKKEIAVREAGAAAAWNREWYAALRKQSVDRREPSCQGCPLHCRKQPHMQQEALLNELGMDVIAAENAAAWAAEQGIPVQGLFEDIACRRGIGDRLAEGMPSRKGKGGSRRSGSYKAMAEAFQLPPDAPETEQFCRNLTEAISAGGQCMFTVNVLGADTPILPVLPMLTYVTGREWKLEELLRIGRTSRELEQRIREKFKKK